MRIFLSFKDGRTAELVLAVPIDMYPRVVIHDYRLFVFEYTIHGEDAAQYTEQEIYATSVLCSTVGDQR